MHSLIDWRQCYSDTSFTTLGPGLLESTYEACYAYGIRQTGLFVQTQVALPILYNDVKIDAGYRFKYGIKRMIL